MEAIHHFNSVRLRATGSGNLKLSLSSLDDVNSITIPSLTLQETTDRELVRLANFTNQRARLIIKVTDIDENFIISKIIIYVRPFSLEYPA